MSSRSIIAICGFAGSGKDTLANYLIQTKGYTKLSFAGTLKDMVSALFGWERSLLEGDTAESRAWRETVDPWWSARLDIEGLTPRKMLQYIGSEVMRKHFHEDIWIACLERKIEQLGGNIVITDCRFPNELSMLKRIGARFLHVVRGDLPTWFQDVYDGKGGAPIEIHMSETSWIPCIGSMGVMRVDNNGSIDDLYTFVEKVLLG